jgi:hypothetical protein
MVVASFFLFFTRRLGTTGRVARDLLDLIFSLHGVQVPRTYQ